MSASPYLICKQTFNTQALINDTPPRWSHPYKKLVYHLACPPGCTHNGDITFSRWSAFPLPQFSSSTKPSTTFKVREDVFGYEPAPDPSITEWYLNFAHHNLFIAYGGPLFAQDEWKLRLKAGEFIRKPKLFIFSELPLPVFQQPNLKRTLRRMV